MKDQYPRVILFLEMPPHLVDVNVHPTKREVRFVQPNAVHQFVSDSLAKYLSQAPWAKGGLSGEAGFPLPELSRAETVPLRADLGENPVGAEAWGGPRLGETVSSPQENFRGQWFSENLQPLTESAAFSHIGRLPFSSLTVIGQLKGTYILCQSEEHFVILDQHAAHERIGFERLKSQARTGGIAVQRFLSPQLIELSEAEMEFVKPHLSSWEKLGLLVEEFGPQTLALKGAPALLGSMEGEPLVRSLIRDFEEHGQSTRMEDRLDEIFATMACHRQIRAGDFLTLREMEELVSDLDEGAYGYHCPHGRPVMVQIPFREIEKWFKRVL